MVTLDLQYRTFFHLSCLVVGGYANIYAHLHLVPQIWGGISVFLTQWGHNFNTLYFIYVLFLDVQEMLTSSKKGYQSSRPSSFKKYFFALTFTWSAIVCLLFWALMAVDPRMVLPKEADAVYPLWLNLVQHLVTFLFIAVELVVCEQDNLPLKNELTLMSALITIYMSWMNLVAYMDRFPYPFQNQMDLVGHLIFNVGAISLAIGILFFKRRSVQMLWPVKSEKKQTNGSNGHSRALKD